MPRPEHRKADTRARDATSKRATSPAAGENLESRLGVSQTYLIAAGLILLLVSLGWAYWPTLSDMVRQWSTQPDYSHGFLVVPLSLAFLWSRRSQFPKDDLCPSVYGAIVL